MVVLLSNMSVFLLKIFLLLSKDFAIIDHLITTTVRNDNFKAGIIMAETSHHISSPIHSRLAQITN